MNPQGSWELTTSDEAAPQPFNEVWKTDPFKNKKSFQLGPWLMEKNFEA
jgi:hypothetical protein